MSENLEFPTELILNPPIWIDPSYRRTRSEVVFGPFVFERTIKNGNTFTLLGMGLNIQGDEFYFFDGDRVRYYEFDKVDIIGQEVHFSNPRDKYVFRPIELKDAELVGQNPKRVGLTKEQLINEALRLFQPRV